MKHSSPAKLDSSRATLSSLSASLLPALRRTCAVIGIAALSAGAAVAANAPAAADNSAPAAKFVPKDGKIGYVMTDLYWAIYQTPDAKSECPKGFNDGPREQYAVLFPGSKKRTVVDTQLKLETETWLPTPDADSFPFHEATGAYSYGLNLDGKVGPHDFTSPDGEKGIDNQLYRALGCIIGFRGPDGVEYIFENKAISSNRYNRTMIEITGVNDLSNDNDVQVTIYRGLDRLLTDATGNKVVAGGSQRIDARWGRSLIQQIPGKIVDGVLTTQPSKQMVIPWMNLGVPTFQLIRDMRFQLKLTPTGAEGLIAGYADVDTWYKQLIRNDSTHHLSNGQISGISLYKALRRLADAHADPKTGANTAISSALNAKFTQVYINPLDDAVKAQVLKAAKSRQIAATQSASDSKGAAAR
ncbi:MAG TPA: hypothetical protein VGN07_23370 [Steroidobacteraceae bacterium]|jgi:hypothetical protein